MSEIAAVPKNGLRIISTFSGCGGSCLGFEMAGYQILAASEFVPAARETYELNHPGVPIDPRDVRLVEPSELLALAGVGVGEIDVLEGSPPCSSFSTAGKGSKHWGETTTYSDTEQRTDDLFFEFARLVEGIQPRAFIAENVSGLVKGDAKGYFKLIFRRLAEAGYRVEARMLDAQWLGVPQRRKRIIFQGIRNDLDRTAVWPSPLPYRYTIAEAIGGRVRHDLSSSWSIGDVTHQPSPTILAQRPSTFQVIEPVRVLARDGPQFSTRVHEVSPVVTTESRDLIIESGDTVTDPETGERIDLNGTAIGRAYGRLAAGEASEKYLNLVRPKVGGASPTVTAIGGHSRGIASVTHPASPRKFTLGELRRICGFPDDFILTGSYSQRWERLGRAVPPPMMAAVAQALTPVLL